ncbi:amidohydrolase [Tabrizicola sp. BL-A-41-H6]|uniref:amidohydrolase n=1 Tax=Tabrizicola sp. BL-A-41-H6 TaxID=3421107 RepID=UPI003D677626
MKLSRRSFLASVSVFALVPMVAHAATPAETIYSGGAILTMDDANPRVEAVAVAGGRIIAAGSLADVSAFKGPDTVMVDLAGRAMIPGFFDPHGHMTMGGIQALSANVLAPPDGEVTDIASLIETVKDWAVAQADIVAEAKLIIGFGYDQSQLAELRGPTKEDLDQVSTEYPVLIVHQSGHMGALNSKALELVGYTADTPNPAGGVIQRVPGSNEPLGILEETAFMSAMPKLLGNLGPEGLTTLAVAGSKMWAAYGYTTAQEGRSNAVVDAALKAAAAEGKFPIDVYSYPDVLLGADYIKGAVSPTYENGFRVAGAKLTIDGSPQGFTAWRDRPYYAPIGEFPPGYVGYPAVTNEQVIEAVDWAYANDIQIIVHSNGEAASDLLIAALRAAEAKHGRKDRRPALIHGQFEREDQVQAFVDLGVIPSLFPMHTFYWGDWHRDHTVGPALADNISPTGWYRARGSIFTSHSDAPVAFPDTMRILDATVTRRSRSGDIIGPAQRVDVVTALKAMTLWAARQGFEDVDKGSIEVGKRADLVILSADPTAIDPETLDQLKVSETIKDGKSIYQRGAKKTELVPGHDLLRPGLDEMFRELHIARHMELLPPAYRTEEARVGFAATFDDCGITLLFPWLFDLPEVGAQVAAN